MKFEGSIEFSVTERTRDRVVSEMPVTAGIKNPFGVVHAGAMLWLADVTATVLVMDANQAAEGMKGFPLAISLNANFLGSQLISAARPPAPGGISGGRYPLSRNRRSAASHASASYALPRPRSISASAASTPRPGR
jgi:1,4-dihydroxy-2-naphthoyl-CoA hydrolase